MKLLRAPVLLAIIGLASAAPGATVFTENFNGYTDGALLNQGSPPWLQLGASVVNPVQVNSGSVALANTGQDLQRTFSVTNPLTAGMSLTTEFDVTIGTAGTGDFFSELTSSVFGSAFFNRFYVRTGLVAGTTMQLGLAAGNPVGSVAYGADLLVGVSYHVASTWNFVAGAANDTFSMTVNGVPYISEFAWNTASPEPPDLFYFNLRQGTSGSSPAVSALDNIAVNSVPEPSSIVLAILGAGTLLLYGRKRPAVR